MTGDLIEKLEKADAGSRELDCEVGLIARLDGKGRIGLHNGVPALFDAGGVYAPQAYTTSLDAALALAERVLPGWCWGVATDKARFGAVLSPVEKANAPHSVDAYGATPALALVIAILKARTAASSSSPGTEGGA